MATLPVVSFATKVDYATNPSPNAITSADLNGDGKADIILTTPWENNPPSYGAFFSVFINNGNGTFAPQIDYAIGDGSRWDTRYYPWSVTSADVNADGKVDLIVGSNQYLTGTLSVFINNGNGTFAPKVDYATGYNPWSVTSADFNGDGKPDIITANLSTGVAPTTLSLDPTLGSVSVHINNGNGTFAPQVIYATGSPSSSGITADVNGDGKPDIIAANTCNGVNSLSVLINNGNGTFAPRVDYATGTYPNSITSADLNGDGKADLITSNAWVNTVSVLLNKGNGTFAQKVDYSISSEAPDSADPFKFDVTTADVNGDGKADLIVTNRTTSTLSVLAGNGDGTFAAKVDFSTGSSWAFTSADVNGDGKPDMITADRGSSTMSVLINNGSGSSTFTSTSGNDTFTGGAGIDTTIFSGNRADYTLTKTTSGWTVSSATNGVDTLTSIERLQFSDKVVASDISGNAGQVYRIYQAAFNRTPDKGGLGDWIYGMDHGASLLDVSAGFVNSAEFKTVYGQNPTDSEVVTRFYQNVLHRAPEQAGYDYWMNQIQSGLQTRTQVLTGFSESPENQAQVIGVIQNGIEYTQHHV